MDMALRKQAYLAVCSEYSVIYIIFLVGRNQNMESNQIIAPSRYLTRSICIKMAALLALIAGGGGGSQSGNLAQ